MTAAVLIAACAADLYAGVIGIGASGPLYGYTESSFGTLSRTQYQDRAFTPRTITVVTYNTASGELILRMAGLVSNVDTTFERFLIDGQTFTRAAASYTGVPGDYSRWLWTPGVNHIGTTGNRTFVLL